jgi:hypothetical protein
LRSDNASATWPHPHPASKDRSPLLDPALFKELERPRPHGV